MQAGRAGSDPMGCLGQPRKRELRESARERKGQGDIAAGLWSDWRKNPAGSGCTPAWRNRHNRRRAFMQSAVRRERKAHTYICVAHLYEERPIELLAFISRAFFTEPTFFA